MVFLPGEVVVDYGLRIKREFDGARVWVSSGNFTDRSFCVDYNNAIVIEQAAIVDAFEAQFARMFDMGMFGPEAPRAPATLRRIDDAAKSADQQRDGHADQEGRIDQASQNEHLGLQIVHQLGLTRRSFEELATHQGNTDRGANGTQTDDDAASQSNKTQNVFHDDSFDLRGRLREERKRKNRLRG